MRMLIITSSLPPAGGAEKVAWDFAISLKNNNNVHVITFGREDTIKNIEGISVYFLKQRSHGLWYYLTFGRKRILNILEEIKPDVINAHMHSIVAFVLRFYPARKILTLHNSRYEHYNKTFIQKIKHYIFTKRTVAKYDVVTTVSKHMQKYFIKEFKTDILHIPNGVDVNIFYPDINIKRQEKQILYVGRLVEFKGVIILFELAKQLTDYSFVFVGDGPLYKQVDLPNIFFVGRKESKEIAKYYNKTTFAIFPSQYENFPLVGLESMACGAIVIANNNLGYNEYIVNNKDGILVEIGNSDGLAKLVRGINQNTIDKIRNNAYETVRYYSLKNIINQYEKLFSKTTLNRN